MNLEERKQIKEAFEQEHEARAQAGRPGSWADMPLFAEVFDSWPADSRTAFLEAGNDAWNEYMLETRDRHSRCEREAANGDPSYRAWQAFLDDTRQFRVKFRTLVLAKFFDLESKIRR